VIWLWKGGNMAVQKKGKQKRNQTHRVEIVINGGDLSYSIDNFKVDQGDSIIWSCDKRYGHCYSVHLGYKSPLAKGRYRRACGQEIIDRVSPKAEPGDYKYIVAVCDGENIWTDDPIFIVKRPSG
jgi:plastocyanin